MKSKNRVEELERVRQSQRMEAMGQLAGGIAHDFNNLLAIIMMSCELSPSDGPVSAAVQERLNQIMKSSEQAAALTRQLLAFSRKQVLQPKVLNVNTVIADVTKLLTRTLAGRVELKTKLVEDLVSMRADAGQIEQILMNLVVNARDAMPNGGTVTIETANAVIDDSMTGFNPKVEPGSYVMFSVRDTGTGMDPETLARIFEPFFTTKEVGKGTGLGLATVYGVVKQNKGTIWVYSEVGKGTVFKVYFPALDQPENAKSNEEIRVQNLRGTEKVLLVEDQDDLRSILSATLKANGYRVTDAVNGAKALAILEKDPQAFDLILTDVIMPQMGGPQLAEQAIRLNPELRFLFLSGYTEERLVLPFLPEAEVNMVEKPFTLTSVLQRIRNILD